MKNTRMRSFIVFLLTFAFLGGLGFFVYQLIQNSEKWAMQPINKHISMRGLAEAGKIWDRNGVLLAKSENGKRIYHEDVEVRRAMLHTVGDESGYISTAVQNIFRSELFGYNFLTGINSPQFLKATHDIHLTLDSKLCKLALQKFGEYNGAAAIYNYKTGEILMMISLPTYDIMDKPDLEKYETEKYEGVYLNKVLSSSFTPGSVFKIITAICAIDNMPNWKTKTFECRGKEILGSEKLTCMGTHGTINLREGMRVSCNIVLGKFAMELGAQKMTKTANALGFNRGLSVDGAETKPSVYDVAGASQTALAWSSVGQQKDLLNPMHALTLLGAIANKGVAVLPSVRMHEGPPAQRRYLTEATADEMKEILRNNVKNHYGDSLFPGMQVCAKTGTAEVGGNKRPTAWIVLFSGEESMPYAALVVVENAGFGREVATPIASALMQTVKTSFKRF